MEVVSLSLIYFGCSRLLWLHTCLRCCNAELDEPSISPTPPYQKPSIRPQLIPPEEGFIASLGKLMGNATSSLSEILSNVFPGFKRKQLRCHYQNQPPFHQDHKYESNPWPVQDSYVETNLPLL